MLRIERKLQIGDDSLGETVVRTILRLTGADFGNNEDCHDENAHESGLGSLKWRWLWTPIPLMLYTATAVQLVLFILALTVSHYRFM